jgi:hypothetical protein
MGDQRDRLWFGGKITSQPRPPSHLILPFNEGLNTFIPNKMELLYIELRIRISIFRMLMYFPMYCVCIYVHTSLHTPILCPPDLMLAPVPMVLSLIFTTECAETNTSAYVHF